jgi:hypothetical protein
MLLNNTRPLTFEAALDDTLHKGVALKHINTQQAQGTDTRTCHDVRAATYTCSGSGFGLGQPLLMTSCTECSTSGSTHPTAPHHQHPLEQHKQHPVSTFKQAPRETLQKRVALKHINTQQAQGANVFTCHDVTRCHLHVQRQRLWLRSSFSNRRHAVRHIHPTRQPPY